MPEQLDLFPDTVMTPIKRVEESIDVYMSMWKSERRVATLRYLMVQINKRLDMENN